MFNFLLGLLIVLCAYGIYSLKQNEHQHGYTSKIVQFSFSPGVKSSRWNVSDDVVV